MAKGQNLQEKEIVQQLKQNVYKEICLGTPYNDIKMMLMKDYWQLNHPYGEDRAKEFISRVRKDIREGWAEKKEGLREVMLERFTDTYNDARKSGDRFNALGALKELSKLTGLYEPEKHQVELNGTIEIDFGFDDEG